MYIPFLSNINTNKCLVEWGNIQHAYNIYIYINIYIYGAGLSGWREKGLGGGSKPDLSKGSFA